LPFYNEAALAQDVKAIADIPPDAVRLNANENPLGPCPAALEAVRAVASQGNRYPFRLTDTYTKAVAEAVGLPPSHVPPAAAAAPLVAAGADVIVLRTFSKIYGMAGLRAGAALGRPDLLEKLGGFGGINFLPATGLAAAVASLADKSVVPDRRKAAAEVREDLFAW